MLVFVWTRNDATGLLDDEFRNNDLYRVEEDTEEPNLGSQEKKSWLVIKVPDPPNKEAVKSQLVEPEYTTGPISAVVRRKRKYYCDWRSKFSAEEIAIAEDANAQFADGPLPSGGSVTAGVVSGKFTVNDFLRKA